MARKYVGMKIVVSAAFWRKIEEEKNNSCPFRDISLYYFLQHFPLGLKEEQWAERRQCMKIKD